MKTIHLFIAAVILLLLSSVAVAQLNYNDILLSPEKFVGKKATMQGKFSYKNPRQKYFTIKQGDNRIKVYYENLSKNVQASILNQKDYSNILVTVKGTVYQYTDLQNSYYIEASNISWK